MKVESIQNDNYQNNSGNNISFAELKAQLTSAAYNESIQKKLNSFLDQTNAALSDLQKQATKTPEGPLKTALNGAIGALNQKKETLADMFKDVITYSVVGMWQMARTNMNNIESTQNCQNHMMNLDEMVETQAQETSNNFSTNILGADIRAINNAIDAGGDNESSNVNVATTQFNLDNTKMSTIGTFFSGINNLLNNGISSIAQNISVNISNMQSFQKYCDAIGQSIQPQ